MVNVNFEFNEFYEVTVSIEKVEYIDNGYGDHGYEIDYSILVIISGNDNGDIVGIPFKDNYCDEWDKETNEKFDEVVSELAITSYKNGLLEVV